MEHPSPLTRPIIMDVLENLRKQVIYDYKDLEKTATNLEKAEEILKIITQASGVNQKSQSRTNVNK